MLSKTGLGDILDTDDPDTIMTSEEVENGDGSTTIINKFFDIASMVDDYLENHRGVKISSDEIWRSIHDTYLAGYTEDFSDADAEEIVGDVVRRLHTDYIKTHTSNSSHKTWSTI